MTVETEQRNILGIVKKRQELKPGSKVMGQNESMIMPEIVAEVLSDDTVMVSAFLKGEVGKKVVYEGKKINNVRLFPNHPIILPSRVTLTWRPNGTSK